MMDELISREALVREVIGLTIVSPEVMNYANAVAVAIENAPIVDAEPVRHGHWIHKLRQYEMDECDCSECGQLMTTAIGQRMSYCPNCGAKMDKEK